MAVDWRTDILPEATNECLDCILEAEINTPGRPAKSDTCYTHFEWRDVSEDQRETCGLYSISRDHYAKCRIPLHLGDGEVAFKRCAFNLECARSCTREYLDATRTTDCGRKHYGARTCLDYGAMHTYPQGCASKHLTFVASFLTLMIDKCGIMNPDLLTSTQSPAPPGTDIGTTVASVLVASIALLIAIIIVMLYLKRHMSKLSRLESSKAVNMYMYNRGGNFMINSSGMAFSFDYYQCTPKIVDMLIERQISLSDIDLHEEIGKGHYGIIRRASLYLNADHTESAVTAVKMPKNITENDINDILREAYTMYRFNHLNVLSIIGVVWQNGDPPLVVLPHMGKGSLLDLVSSDEASYTPTDLLNFVVQVSAGLEYLESVKFVHRDIALRNCLVSKFYVVKISDFGLSRDVYNTGIYDCDDGSGEPFDITKKALPWKWLAPECLSSGLFTHKSDVWAFGILIWELYNSGRPPYPAIGNISVLQECLNAGYRLSKPDSLQPELKVASRPIWVSNMLWRKISSFCILLCQAVLALLINA